MALLVAQGEVSMAQVISALSKCVEKLAADTEARTLRVIGIVVHRLEQEIEAVVVSAATRSEQNTHSVVDGLRDEIRAHLAQNRADFERRQEETMQTVAQVSASLDILTKKLNQFKPASGVDVGDLKKKLSNEVAQKLSESDKRVDQLSTTVEGQKKSISDNSELLIDLLIGIENLGDNLKNIQKEMDY